MTQATHFSLKNKPPTFSSSLFFPLLANLQATFIPQYHIMQNNMQDFLPEKSFLQYVCDFSPPAYLR